MHRDMHRSLHWGMRAAGECCTVGFLWSSHDGPITACASELAALPASFAWVFWDAGSLVFVLQAAIRRCFQVSWRTEVSEQLAPRQAQNPRYVFCLLVPNTGARNP